MILREELVLYLNILNDNLVKSRRLECFWSFDIVSYNFAQKFIPKDIHFPTDEMGVSEMG